MMYIEQNSGGCLGYITSPTSFNTIEITIKVIDRANSYCPYFGIQGLMCVVDWIKFHSDNVKKLLSLFEFKKIFFNRKVFMKLKTYQNLRF